MSENAAGLSKVVLGLQNLNRPAYRLFAQHRGKIRVMSWLLFAIIAVLVVWDLFLATNAQDNDTWSEQARLAAPRVPVLPWLLGAMIGHVFPLRRFRPPQFNAEAAGGAMCALTGLMILWTVLITSGVEIPISPPAIWLTAIAGLVASYVLWPMRPPANGGQAK